jgi:hypothetical protein
VTTRGTWRFPGFGLAFSDETNEKDLCAMPGSSPRLRFHAVTVVAGSHGCAAAQVLRDVRLLSADAPRLPLANCEHPATCTCRFQHHDDRRAGPRRALEVSRSASRHLVVHDRRERRGRRESDFDDEL